MVWLQRLVGVCLDRKLLLACVCVCLCLASEARAGICEFEGSERASWSPGQTSDPSGLLHCVCIAGGKEMGFRAP